jgi:NAD(P)-dependent dehydrogenase (short-subunit alcohol dehydrogenase family)
MSQPVVLITGALTGIGRATALAFAKNGARLVVAGRRPTEGKALEVELQLLGAEAVFVQADVRHDEEVRRLIDQAVLRDWADRLCRWRQVRRLMPLLSQSTFNQ